MGEVSKSIVAVLAIAVIIVSAVGTWIVMDTTIKNFGGMEIPAAGSANFKPAQEYGKVSVYVNDTGQPASELAGAVTAGSENNSG
ncbi:MAG: hypothetical protein DRO99_00585 [Candidatus Aenigmatarchaeota archaeon]|nr:MAG: hypothetical protein DRO99_00585 [Candidatus Aenigmarchaeota archaeon]